MPKNNRQWTGRSVQTATATAAPPKQPVTAKASITPHFMSVDDVARLLAVSTKTIRRAIKDRRLRPTAFGRRVLVSQGALEQFITALIALPSAPPPPRKKR
jgi:excisionase family DNA binding protein